MLRRALLLFLFDNIFMEGNEGSEGMVGWNVCNCIDGPFFSLLMNPCQPSESEVLGLEVVVSD